MESEDFKEIECPHCQCQEFITDPNRYDIYESVEGKLVLVDSPFIDDISLYCRECGEIFDDENCTYG